MVQELNSRDVICVNNIEKNYSNKLVLRNISFCVRSSELVVIVGPSGSGKTTLLGIIAGFEKPDKGEIVFLGRKINEFDNQALAEYRNKHIGFVFQNFNLIPFLTAIENVMIPLILSGSSEKSAKIKASKILSELGLKDELNNYPYQLSGGQQQRVAIARAIINDPELILADEPTANLDPENEKAIMEILSNIAKRGKSIILVTHKEYLAEFASRVLKLENGRLTEE